MIRTCQGYVDIKKADKVIQKMRSFFQQKGFIESCSQQRRTILAACEDPPNVTTYNIGGMKWPLPQTNQMNMEYDLLTDPSLNGLYCLTTSYRNEPNPKPRHDLTFPLFEFESKGHFYDLVNMCSDLLRFLGYKGEFKEINYVDACEKYGVQELNHDHEKMLYEDFGPVVFLKNFPMHTDPFWNMALNPNGKTAKKLDVLLSGVETFGTAERSISIQDMRHQFHTVTGGKYAELLYKEFGKDRVDKELEEYFSHNMFRRYGGGIGVTRLIKSMQKEGLM